MTEPSDTPEAVESLADWFHRELGLNCRHEPANTRPSCEAWADQMERTWLARDRAQQRAQAWDELHRHVCIDPDGPHMPLSRHANPYRASRTVTPEGGQHG